MDKTGPGYIQGKYMIYIYTWYILRIIYINVSGLKMVYEVYIHGTSHVCRLSPAHMLREGVKGLWGREDG